MIEEMKECLICKTPVTPLLDMGEQYVVDFVKEKDEKLLKAPLILMKCPSCHLVQLKNKVSPERLYRKFWYRSGINEQMRDELLAVVQHAQAAVQMEPGDRVLDIGANDGTLLGWYDKRVMTFGVDPCGELIAEGMANDKIDVGIPEFFSKEAVTVMGVVPKFKIITAVAMFYDVSDPVKFLEDCRDLLDDEGILIIQLNYLGTMLKDCALDFICHEHIAYYSLLSLQEAVKRAGLEIKGVELSQSNGGSLRVYISHPPFVNKMTEETKSLGDTMYTTQLLEMKMGLDTNAAYYLFSERAKNLATVLKMTLEKYAPLYAYGASTRGTVLTQFMFRNGGSEMVLGVADRDEHKIGLRMVGTWWPIITEEEFRSKAKTALVLPWHFRESIRKREEKWLEGGGRFIFPLPRPMIVETEQRIATMTIGAK
jgi:NDP-4-keto-2,6-dideoxyhexose 3-C-methyltransferase